MFPVYAVRSRRNWGMGDFTDLRSLVEFTAESGGDLFQTLDKLTHLERRGWWSLGTALIIIFALTADSNSKFQFDYAFGTVPVESATPLPGTLPLFVTGLGGLGLLGWRRKRKTAALAA